MTIVFSCACPFVIIMTADSAVTQEFEDHFEFETGCKIFPFSGIGCVTTWGERVGNQIGTFLRNQELNPIRHDVTDLANLVEHYLITEYQPDRNGLGDVGYHVAGFDKEGLPKLYHVFWGFDRPRPPNQEIPKYARYDHSPSRGGAYFLYNGRNDLAHIIVNAMLNQISQGNLVRYDLRNPLGLAQFGDFVLRFGAELTPEVGPPFIVQIISPENRIERIVNRSFSPVGQQLILPVFQSLGYRIIQE